MNTLNNKLYQSKTTLPLSVKAIDVKIISYFFAFGCLYIQYIVILAFIVCQSL
jgi:hypothetical protein